MCPVRPDILARRTEVQMRDSVTRWMFAIVFSWVSELSISFGETGVRKRDKGIGNNQ